MKWKCPICQTWVTEEIGKTCKSCRMKRGVPVAPVKDNIPEPDVVIEPQKGVNELW